METQAHEYRDELLEIADAIRSRVERIRETPVGESAAADRWNRTLDDVREQIAEERLLRVAVVGAIKSGKSTFVNALLGGDYLRRGAGVITSMVTRVQRGESLGATLVFKSLGAVNAEIHRAMTLFPGGVGTGDSPFDIRREADRKALAAALETLDADKWIGRDALNIDGLRLAAYLDGYDSVAEWIGEETSRRTFSEDDFPAHRDFAGNDALSIYLEDMVLEVPAPDPESALDSGIEVADCQGSDSPNPMHLAMIQEYLRRTHLIVYVVGARMGIRQADIAFLSIIREMGILDNAVFLLNVDIGEHESLDDMNRVAESVRADLSLMRPDPPLYVFSALLNLFRHIGEPGLSVKDRLRFAAWRGERAMVARMDEEWTRFDADIRRKLTRERYALLLGNPLARLDALAGDLEHWSAVRGELLRKDADGVRALVADMAENQERLAQVRELLRDTLRGAVDSIKDSLRVDVTRFFDNYSGVTGRIFAFLREYKVDASRYSHTVQNAGFQIALYRVFQEVRQGLDGFLAGTANPEIIGFIRETEAKISAHFAAVAGPFDGMIRDALADYNRKLAEIGLSPAASGERPPELPDMDTLRKRAGLDIPSATAAMSYTATVRAEAVARLGIYRGIRWLRRLFRQPAGPADEAERALEDAVVRLKRETEKSLDFTLKSFRENLKYQYIHRLVDTAEEALMEVLLERLSAYDGDLSDLAGLADRQESERIGLADVLDGFARESAALRERLKTLRDALRQGE